MIKSLSLLATPALLFLAACTAPPSTPPAGTAPAGSPAARPTGASPAAPGTVASPAGAASPGAGIRLPGGATPAIPASPVAAAPARLAIVRFERGHMIWREDARQIYVLPDAGAYAAYADTFGPGDPEQTGLTAPPGLAEPVRGFGKVWRENRAVQDGLGWAAAPEQGVEGTISSDGNALTIDARGLGAWTLRRDGTYTKTR